MLGMGSDTQTLVVSVPTMYHTYCLEDSSGDKDGQSSTLRQFSV